VRVSQALEEAIQLYHEAADDFSRGNPSPVNELLSTSDDVTLANPFGPAVRGLQQVSDALDFASSRFRDGKVERFETLAKYVTSDLATLLEVEHWTAKVGGADERTPFILRVSTTLRRETDGWRLVHRQADPIATPDAAGPLRK
jgi:ketosteroid isomerase-like protein